MGIDMTRYKVVYGDRVLNAVSIENYILEELPEDAGPVGHPIKAKVVGVLVINEDGNLELIDDEAWQFQFIPILSK